MSENRMMEKLRERRAKHKQKHIAVRAIFALVGFTILLAGLAILVLPGPALAVIPIGLTLLALEFAWAERALSKALAQAEKAKASAKSLSRTHRIIVGVGIVATLAAAGSVIWLYGLPWQW